MAVRERTYRTYDGALTTDRWRFLIIPRYAYQEVFASRRFLTMLVASMVWPVVSLVMIYLHHNLEALDILNLRPRDLLSINGEFFFRFYSIQGSLGFALAFVMGPPLVSADMAHNALPLYLARPFSRVEYILGKLSVLAILLSLITWVPGLLLFAFQTSLEGTAWAAANLWLVAAIVLAGWMFILVTSLITLALSAWVRWRALARGLLLGVYVFSVVLSEAINGTFRTDWGSVLNPARTIVMAWLGLFRMHSLLDQRGIPLWSAWVALAVMCVVALVLLERKVRAYEVVG